MTESETPAPSPDMGLLARAIGVITSPTATFQAIVQQPRPVIILLLIALVTGVSAAIPQFTERGRQAALQMQVEQMERFTGQPLSDEMYQRMEAQSHSPIGGIGAVVGTLIFMPIIALFFTALYWAVFNAVLGGTAAFKQVLGVVTHSMVVLALGALATLPVQLMSTKWTTTGPFNLAALAPMLAPESFLSRVLSGLNVFTIWQIAILGIGLGVLYKKKPGGITVTLMVLYVVIVVGVVSIFSSFMGR
ncbi:MAG: YIP1 family protein [Vicinamibacterales bacterium]